MAQLPDYDSPSALKAFLEEREMGMQKKFGQNFLINSSARRKLADALDVTKGTRVWEVGPGLGALTSGILEKGADLTAFEIDRGFAKALESIFADEIKENRFRLVVGDVLKTWKSYFEKNGTPDRFFGNLPYNVAAVIVGDFISAGLRFEKSVVTVQKEVGLRMTAKPGSEDYSSFSVLCQWAYDITPLMDLSGGSFWPRPNVDSRAVLMTKKENFPNCKDPKHFMQMQRALFVSRRKTVKNNLSTFLSDSLKADAILQKARIDPSIRAERLDIETLLHLSDVCGEL
jgi:16S rRNA (adenine1518-N6/adenine1519-N6)-dimethyltransferase